MLWLEKNAKKILTDSGGVQKEAYWSKVPCVTMLDVVCWPEIVREGWNVSVGASEEKIIDAIKNFDPKILQKKTFW